MEDFFFFLSDNTWWLLGAVAGMSVCVVINIWGGRRSFYRTNQAGLETFSGYRSVVLTRLGEGVMKIIAILSFLFSLSCMAVIFFKFVMV